MNRKFRNIERGYLATATLAITIGVLTTALSPVGSNAETGDESTAAAEAAAIAENSPGAQSTDITAAPAAETEVAGTQQQADPPATQEPAAEPATAEPATEPVITEPVAIEPFTILEATDVSALSGATDFTDEDAHVLRLYSAIFDREPELDGAQFWLGEVRNGRTVHDIAVEFAASPEFEATYGAMDDATFVRTVYRTALDRDIDQEGFDFWVGELGAGMPREKVVVFFTSGEEFGASAHAQR